MPSEPVDGTMVTYSPQRGFFFFTWRTKKGIETVAVWNPVFIARGLFQSCKTGCNYAGACSQISQTMFPSVRVSWKQEQLPLIHTALHLPLLLLGLMLDGTARAVRQCPSAPQRTLTGHDFWFCYTSCEVVTLRKSL